MHIRYLVFEDHHAVVRETDGTIVEDTRSHIVIRPTGARFTIDVLRSHLLSVIL
jgi:hypothetical protein